MNDDYLGPEPTRDETAADQEREYEVQRLNLMTERDRYRDALRKIAAWKGYTSPVTGEWGNYERGANDMLSTLQAMAREALA